MLSFCIEIDSIIISNYDEKEGLQMIYLVYGEQFPLINKRVKKLISSILVNGAEEFNFVRFNAREVNVQDIAYECSLLPFADRKVVRVDNPYFLNNTNFFRCFY